jgi:hypothetical protein
MKMIKEIKIWEEGNRIGDWLHPSYGPFPDFAAIYEDKKAKYISAVWKIGTEIPNGWSCMVEGRLTYKNLDTFKIARTYYWKIINRCPVKVHCKITKNYSIDYEINGDFIRNIAEMSINIFKRKDAN